MFSQTNVFVFILRFLLVSQMFFNNPCSNLGKPLCLNVAHVSVLLPALTERVPTYHGDGCGRDRRADRRPWDDAAQRRAHIHRQQEAFTHRVDVLRTQQWHG